MNAKCQMHRISNCIVSKSQTSNANQTEKSNSTFYQKQKVHFTVKVQNPLKSCQKGFGKDIKEKIKCSKLSKKDKDAEKNVLCKQDLYHHFPGPLQNKKVQQNHIIIY